jgi:hypothetical protein
MRMSVLERRVQILVDQARYERLERAASAESRSVASIIREAIDMYLQSDAGANARALASLLDMPTDSAPGQDWEDSKEGLLAQAVEGYPWHVQFSSTRLCSPTRSAGIIGSASRVERFWTGMYGGVRAACRR